MATYLDKILAAHRAAVPTDRSVGTAARCAARILSR